MRSGGLQAAVKAVVKSFLEQSHYQDLHRLLSDEWSHCHSLYAAVRLMEAHGVYISPEKEDMYANMPEDKMIDVLVMLMPQQNREQFEHFFLQLSLIASTTTRLRAALESGNEVAVEEVLESAENVGILSYILKMAVAQAGQEVKNHDKDHNDWLAACADRMSPLLQSQANAMISQKALQQARAQLSSHQIESNEKTKKALLGFASSNDTVLRNSCFELWADEVRQMKREREIRQEYEEEIALADKRLQDYVLQQTGIMRNMLNKKYADTEEGLKHMVIDAFINEVQEKRDRAVKELEMADLNNKMSQFAEDQRQKAKKTLGRMNAGSDQGLCVMVFAAWTQFIAEYNKNREFEDAVKAEEKKIVEFMKQQNEGAKSVLNRMAGATEHGLIAQSFKGWVDVFEEQKKVNEFQQILNDSTGKLKSFSTRNKESADSCMERTALLQQQSTWIIIFMYWKKEARVERMRRYARDKNVKKKNQLMGVKGLFKNFANELEAGLKEGTPRVDIKKKSGRQASPSPKAGVPA